jgi:hypothetical protein
MQYVGTGRLSTAQNVAYTGTAGTITNAVGPQTYRVRVLCTTDAFVLNVDGAGVVTAATGAYCPALTPEYLTVTPGQKISAIQVAAGGTLYVSEIV